MADWLPLAISATGLGVALAAVLVGFVLRMRGRHEPPATAMVAITAFVVAMSLGLVGVSFSDPMIALITLGIPAALLVLARAYRSAGSFLVGRLPTATEEQHFERRSLEALVDVASGREPDLARLAAEAERLGSPGSDERRRAVAAVALAEARHRIVRGEGDWLEPLVRASERIGADAMGIWRRDAWFVRFVILSAIAAAGVALTLSIAGAP